MLTCAYTAGVDLLLGIGACVKPTPAYPNGRTGTRAGYMAHYFAHEDACMECRQGNRTAVSDDRKADPEHTLRGNLWARFRMTLEDYYSLLERQGGACAICRVTAPTDVRTSRFHVDHDHACCPGRKSCGGCTRGLLCHGCNTALGNFADDPARLQAAIDYLANRSLSHVS